MLIAFFANAECVDIVCAVFLFLQNYRLTYKEWLNFLARNSVQEICVKLCDSKHQRQPIVCLLMHLFHIPFMCTFAWFKYLLLHTSSSNLRWLCVQIRLQLISVGGRRWETPIEFDISHLAECFFIFKQVWWETRRSKKRYLRSKISRGCCRQRNRHITYSWVFRCTSYRNDFRRRAQFVYWLIYCMNAYTRWACITIWLYTKWKLSKLAAIENFQRPQKTQTQRSWQGKLTTSFVDKSSTSLNLCRFCELLFHSEQ